jgi:hypothetical protein
MRSLLGPLAAEMPDDRLALPVSAHWRLLRRIHAPAGGQLSQVLASLPESDREALRAPDPRLLAVLDPRPLLDQAAQLAARFGGTGWLVAETAVAGLTHGRQLWFGNERNVGHKLREIAGAPGITIHVAN